MQDPAGKQYGKATMEVRHDEDENTCIHRMPAGPVAP